MSSPGVVTVHPADRVRGRVRLPGDKSISHRYAILAALADGPSTIHGYSTGNDCASTLSCLRALGVSIHEAAGASGSVSYMIEGRGLGGLVAPTSTLDAGNSGSTMRMLAGVLTAHPFEATLDGDGSLRRRPMRRIIAPLERMGARLSAVDGRPPLTVRGTRAVQALEYQPEVPSAQVKSAILFAGLHADGMTTVREDIPTRDHTERALRAFGVQIRQDPSGITLAGGQRLGGRKLQVPGD